MDLTHKKKSNMDKSQDYIDMCVACSEIQKIYHSYAILDIVSFSDQQNWSRTVLHDEQGNQTLFSIIQFKKIDEICLLYDLQSDNEEQTYFWLPRQDQLQEYMLDQEVNLEVLTERFYQWVDGRHGMMERHKDPEYRIFNSMEQLWLAYFMEHEYNKRWNIKTKQWT